MNYLLSTRRFHLLAAVSLALVILPVVEAEPRCPGNTASVTPRLVRDALIVIPVRINQAGPFDFMVDTGSQVTVIDPSLASELNLKTHGRVGLASYVGVAVCSGLSRRSICHPWIQGRRERFIFSSAIFRGFDRQELFSADPMIPFSDLKIRT